MNLELNMPHNFVYKKGFSSQRETRRRPRRKTAICRRNKLMAIIAAFSRKALGGPETERKRALEARFSGGMERMVEIRRGEESLRG